jgi:rare lipoprotein A (peptidoglycan hydrolase)
MTQRLGRFLKIGALIPVLVTFGFAGWFELQTRTWLAQPSDKDTAGAVVAGVTTERSADWSLAQQAGRQPEIIPVLAFASLPAADAVRAVGVKLGERDLAASYPDSAWGYGGLAQVWRAQSITIKDGRRTTALASWQPTVADVLAEQAIELGEQDKISPALTATVQTADAATPFVITITRVVETTVVVKESIPITTTYKDDPTAEKGTEKVVDAGQTGIKALTYLVRREDGVEVKRVLQSTVAERPMKAKIISRGTKVVVYATGQATWYASDRVMAASYNSLPRWTKVRVVNTQTGKSVVVTIEGGGVYGATIDLGKDAFVQLGNLGTGRLPVRVEKVYE